VPRFTLMKPSKGKTPDIEPKPAFGIAYHLRSSGRELGQKLPEGLFSRPVGGRHGFKKDR
jgi:hypothetical protein